MNNFRPYGNIGLAVRGIEIYYPLSKKLSLALWCSSRKEKFSKLYEMHKYLSLVAPKKVAQVSENPLQLERVKVGLEEGEAIPVDFDNVINCNSLQVKYAARFVYSSSQDFSLAEKMIEANPSFREGVKVKVG